MKQHVSFYEIEKIEQALKIYGKEEDYINLTLQILASDDFTTQKGDIIYAAKEIKSLGEIVQFLFNKPSSNFIPDIPDEFFRIYIEVFCKYRVIEGYKQLEEMLDIYNESILHIQRVLTTYNSQFELSCSYDILNEIIKETMK